MMEQVVKKYGTAVEIPVRFRTKKNEVGIGEYRFNQENFQELILYVWLGGYPRWRDGRRPGYVEEMKLTVEKAGFFPFEGIREKMGGGRKIWPEER
jgi:hypothetical protein